MFERIFCVIGGVFVLVYWSFIFWTLSVDNIQLFWVPSCNILSVLISIYVDKELSSNLTDVELLESLKYDFKSA